MTRSFRAILFMAAVLFPGSPDDAAAQASPPSGGERVVGNWEGALNAGAYRLRMQMVVARDSAGGLAATIASLDQGGVKIPGTVTLQGDTGVRVAIPVALSVWQGRWAGADSLDGTWTQGGASLPLAFRRVARLSELRRPQEPKRPFPYREEEVTFASAEEGARLAGTLTVPPGEGPFPAVVLVSGSGAQDRDESILGHRPFLVLSDHLTRRGIAVLRFDDRGVGKSTGSFAGATTEDFADDVRGALRFLRARPEVAAAKVGIVGHSEGGVIAPMVAAGSREAAFIVMLAGSGVPGDEILRAQGRLIARAAGTPAEAIERNAAVQARLLERVKAGGDTAALRSDVRAMLRAYADSLSDEERRAGGISPAWVEAQTQQLTSPWYRFFIAHDPRPALRRVRVPVLAVGGSLDLQVPATENLAAIEAALREGGNRDVRTVELPRLNHLFQTAATGAVSEYGTIEETLSPAVLDLVSGWILERFGPGK
ncbi:MAG TPA: alpha/beta fold hydrolase [Longimicrobium sp.]|nr:alpha/beta fold hydrolase [Longimicrobium sp.]